MTIAASQKGLMTPAGVSFNFVNDKALARRKALRRRVSSYWDWVPRIEIPLGFCAQLLPRHLSTTWLARLFLAG